MTPFRSPLRNRLGAFCILGLAPLIAAAEAPEPPRSCLQISNRTDRPIYVYLDGRFVTRCEPHAWLTVRCAKLGNVVGTGRFRCETWGPTRLCLLAAKTTDWVFEEPREPPKKARREESGGSSREPPG